MFQWLEVLLEKFSFDLKLLPEVLVAEQYM